MPRTERIRLRVSRHEKDRLERAAQAVGLSVSEFARSRLAKDVDDVLNPEDLTTTVPADVYGALLASLDAPKRGLPVLVELANRPRRYRDDPHAGAE